MHWKRFTRLTPKKYEKVAYGVAHVCLMYESNSNSMVKTCMLRSESPNGTPSARATSGLQQLHRAKCFVSIV
jgi:hypothetical protein